MGTLTWSVGRGLISVTKGLLGSLIWSVGRGLMSVTKGLFAP